jgi:hypothetical protein
LQEVIFVVHGRGAFAREIESAASAFGWLPGTSKNTEQRAALLRGVTVL